MDLPDGGAVTRARSIEGDLKRWGRTLHDALFTPRENRDLLKRLLAAPEPRERPSPPDRVLLRLPWELMADAAGRLAQRVSVRRQLEEPETTTSRPAILPCASSTSSAGRPMPASSIRGTRPRSLFEALDPLGPSVRVDFCRRPPWHAWRRCSAPASGPTTRTTSSTSTAMAPSSPIRRSARLCFEKPDDGSGDSKTDLVHAERLGNLLANTRFPSWSWRRAAAPRSARPPCSARSRRD